MKTLTEPHKKLAEYILSAMPRHEICEKLNISRSTMYKWMQDPDWVTYFETLTKEVEIARHNRLLPITLKAAEAMECALDRAITEISSTDPDTSILAPKLATVADVLKKLVELERLDSGKHTSHRKTELDTPHDPKDSAKEERRDRLIETLEKFLEPHPAQPAESVQGTEEGKPN
jgi:hypothetical protein